MVVILSQQEQYICNSCISFFFCFKKNRDNIQPGYLLLTFDLGGISSSEQLSMVTVETRTKLAAQGQPLDGHSMVSSLEQGDKISYFTFFTQHDMHQQNNSSVILRCGVFKSIFIRVIPLSLKCDVIIFFFYITIFKKQDFDI